MEELPNVGIIQAREKKKYELLVRLVCSAIAGYICNVEMMQLRNKLGGHDAFSCRENLNQSTHL